MADILKTLSPIIQQEVDRHHYDCFGEGSVQIEETGDVTVYILKGDQIPHYLQKAYGEEVAASENDYRGEVRLREVNIFGPEWTDKFGFPFPHSLDEQGLNLGRFDCLSPSAAEKGWGKIRTVNADSIEVEGEGGVLKLQLGACTRL